MSDEVTSQDVKKAAMKIAEETGSNEVSYKALQNELGKLPLGKLDPLVKQLLEEEPDFGELDDKGTAKKSDDELVLKLKAKSQKKKKEEPEETPKEEAKETPKEEAKKEVKKETKKETPKKEKTEKPKQGLIAKIKSWFGK